MKANVDRKRCLAACGLAMLLSGVVVWSMAGRTSFAQNPAGENQHQDSPRSLMADHLILQARAALAGGGTPRADQLVRCGVLLTQAMALNPADAEGWLLMRELAVLMGDRNAEQTALKQYCQLHPEDDAAQFDLIMASVAEHQTVNDRLAAVERVFDSDAARKLSDAVKSRLASTIAEAAKETGDEQRFARWLVAAVEFDDTNKHAAKLTYELALMRSQSANGLIRAMLQLIRADPLDPRSRQSLGDLLLAQGMYDQALAQYFVTRNLGFTDYDERFVRNWMLCLAASGETDGVLSIIASADSALRRQRGDAAGEMVLPMDLELIRVACAYQAQQAVEAEASFKRIRSAYQTQIAKGDEQAAVWLSWWTALFSPAISAEFEAAVAEFAQSHSDNPVAMRTLGWVHLRKSRIEDASAIFHKLAEQDAMSIYGLAQCAGADQPSIRNGYLQRAISMSPTTMVGMLAARDLKQAGGKPDIGAEGAAIQQLLDRMPRGILSPNLHQSPWVLLNISMDQFEFQHLDPMVARIRLRNGTDLPLNLAKGGSVPSRVFIYLTPWERGKQIKGVAPIVVDMGRRMKLGPRESIEVPVRLDRGELGSLLASNPALMVSFSATAVLDPIPAPGGGMTTGPLGATDMIKLVDRKAAIPTDANLDKWITEMAQTTDSTEQMRLLARLCVLVGWLGNAEGKQAQVARIVDIVNAAFPQMDPLRQAWTISFMPGTADVRSLAPNVFDLAQRSDDTMVKLVYLANHVKNAADPMLSAALRDGNANVALFAQALQQSFQQGTP